MEQLETKKGQKTELTRVQLDFEMFVRIVDHGPRNEYLRYIRKS